MLTEVDIERIMTEKYHEPESISETFVDNEANGLLIDDHPFEGLNYDMSNMCDILEW